MSMPRAQTMRQLTWKITFRRAICKIQLHISWTSLLPKWMCFIVKIHLDVLKWSSFISVKSKTRLWAKQCFFISPKLSTLNHKKSCALCRWKLAIHCKLSHDASWEIYVKKGMSVPACHKHLSTSYCYPKCPEMRSLSPNISSPIQKEAYVLVYVMYKSESLPNIEPYFAIGLSGSPTTMLITVIEPHGSIITCLHSWKAISESITLHFISISLLEGCLVWGFRILILSSY